jgi:hypothetical protein
MEGVTFVSICRCFSTVSTPPAATWEHWRERGHVEGRAGMQVSKRRAAEIAEPHHRERGLLRTAFVRGCVECDPDAVRRAPGPSDLSDHK